MRTIGTGGKTAARRGYATDSTLAGIILIAPKRHRRRSKRMSS
jgi:hypothetical protein